MKGTSKAVKFAGTTALAVLITSSAFAADAWDGRNTRQSRDAQRTESRSNGSYRSAEPARSNSHLNVSGKITSLSRERDGYRIRLDRGRDSYWIPASRLGSRARDLRVGISIAIGGIYDRGVFNVDAIDWPGGYGYGSGYGTNQGYLQGSVIAVDYRRALVTVRDSESGRLVDVDMRAISRDILRRGDYVTLEGEWVRGDLFNAYRIDRVS